MDRFGSPKLDVVSSASNLGLTHINYKQTTTTVNLEPLSFVLNS
jgi:hypothetical protein